MESEKIAKEALAIVAAEYGLDGAKSSWTTHAPSTVNRFKKEIHSKLAAQDEEAVGLAQEFRVVATVGGSEPISE